MKKNKRKKKERKKEKKWKNKKELFKLLGETFAKPINIDE